MVALDFCPARRICVAYTIFYVYIYTYVLYMYMGIFQHTIITDPPNVYTMHEVNAVHQCPPMVTSYNLKFEEKFT